MGSNMLSLLGLEYPIFQAPIGGAATPELASATSAAGAMGALALTWTPPEVAEALISQIRTRTDKPFQANFVLASPPVALPHALAAGVPVVTFSWGDPTPYLAQVKAAGVRVGVQVTNAPGAQRMIDEGVDFLICQGIEAGGHVQSTTPLWSLLPKILEVSGDVPVIATGGIGDGAGIARALAMGAAGAMLGTRFVATQESNAHPTYKQKLIDATALDTALTVCFDGDWPYAAHRVIRNATLETWEASGCPPVGQRPGEGEVVALTAEGEALRRYTDTPPRRGMTGSVLDLCLYAGTSCEHITDIPTVSQLIHRLWTEYVTASQTTQNPT